MFHLRKPHSAGIVLLSFKIYLSAEPSGDFPVVAVLIVEDRLGSHYSSSFKIIQLMLNEDDQGDAFPLKTQ